MIKPTTNSYFPFFGVPYHFLLYGKNSRLGIVFVFLGGGGGAGGGLGGGEFWVQGFFWVSSGNQQVRDGKSAWQNNNNNIVCSFNGIPITCRLEMEFFSHKSENYNRCVSCLRNTIESKLNMSSEREFRFGLSQFHCGNEVKQGYKVQTNKL